MSSDFIKSFRKEIGSNSLLESKYSKVDGWISTGSYSINRLISGSIYKGIPNGRVVIVAGPTGVGKTLIAINIAANAINEEKYDNVFYFDAEGGGSIDFFKSFNCDIDKVEHILVDNVEDATIKIIKLYSYLAKYKEINPNYKAICILDSLGALVTTKVYTDVEKDKQVADQGSRAKFINTLVKACTIPCLKTNITMLFINHIYEGPEMYPSKISNQSGGLGLQYMSSITLQCTRCLEKEINKNEENFYKGSRLKVFTVKNRFNRAFCETEAYLDFRTGLSKYDGLVEPAIKYGFIKQCGAWYEVPTFSDKKLRMDEILTNENIWNTFIEEFNKKSKEDLSYRVGDEEIKEDLVEVTE